MVAVTVKAATEVAERPPESTSIRPEAAPEGTTAVICVVESTVIFDAGVPPKRTPVTLENPLPVITTRVPTPPLVGVNEPMPRAFPTVNLESDLATLAPIATRIRPDTASAGTMAEIWVAESTVKLASCPPKRTLVAPRKPVPVMVTLVPLTPLVGAKDDTAGLVTVNTVVDRATPAGVATRTRPFAMPSGTAAVICVGESRVNVASFPQPHAAGPAQPGARDHNPRPRGAAAGRDRRHRRRGRQGSGRPHCEHPRRQ